MPACKYRVFISVVLLGLSLFPPSIPDSNASMFEKGARRLSFLAGSGRVLSNDYFILGLGVGYYIVDGLELGLDGEIWIGDDPDIRKLSPQVKYVLPVESSIKPYIGTFYKHVFIERYDDLDTIGARGGVYFTPDNKWYFGLGGVYESYLDCEETIYRSCDDTYPEITLAVSF